jgi:1-deoxy-D-xylulose-5-phosphate reductoisomerase
MGIALTASGGSARNMSKEELMQAPVESILRHPTWDMGRRITVDSATMVNKGFEVIEAKWLFDQAPVDVVIHPGSIVHSLVRMGDGSWKALMGLPDMKIPIQYALCYPDRGIEPLAEDGPLDWGSIDFLPVDHSRYPAFGLIVDAGESGGTMPAAVNAADEVAVGAFLAGRIRFGEIARVIGEVMDAHESAAVSCLEDVIYADERARNHAEKVVESLC